MLENLGKTVIVTGSQVKKSKSRLLMDFSLLSDSLLWDTKRWVGQHNWCSDSCRWKYAFLCGKHKTKAQLKMNVYWQEVTKRNLNLKLNQTKWMNRKLHHTRGLCLLWPQIVARKSNSEGWTKPSSWWKEESGSPKDFFHNVSFLLCEDRISQILDP